MTGENSAKIDRSFGDLTSRTLKEMMDPLTLLVLDEMDTLRSWMRENPYLHFAALPDAINRVNDTLLAKEMIGRPIVVVGKIRPTMKGMDSDSDLHDTIDEPMFRKIANNLGFGEMYEDEMGPYYMVVMQKAYCGVIDAAYDDSSTPGEPQSIVSLNIITDPEEDPDDTHFAMARDEIEIITTDQPSPEMVGNILEREYPDIFEALQQIPEDETDTKVLLQALNDFKLYVDWTAYPHQDEDELSILEEMIADYITDRIGLDGGLYKFKVKGLLIVIELTEGGPRPCYLPIESPRTIRGYVQGVRLLERGNEIGVPEEVSTYELKFNILARIHGGGNQNVEIPAQSMIKLKSLSNDLLLPDAVIDAENDHFEQIIAIDRSTITTTPSFRSDSELSYSTESPVDSESAETVQLTENEQVDEEATDTPIEHINNRIDGFEAMRTTLEVFMAKCEVYRSTFYNNQSEALQELSAVRDYAVQALGDIIQADVHITFRGKEVKMMPLEIAHKSESNEIMFTAKTSGVIKDNPDSRIGGTLNGCEVHLVKDSDNDSEEKVRINVDFLVSDDNSTLQFSLSDEGVKQEYVKATIVRAFRAAVSKNTEFTLTTHDWLVRVRDRIFDFANLDVSNQEIADDLMQMFAIIDQLSLQQASYSLQLDDFYKFNDYMLNNPEKSHDIEMILTEIFDEKIIAVEGDYNTDDGILYKNKSIQRGWVAGVFVPTEGPCAGEGVFLLRIKDKDTVRVPIRKITRLMY